MEQAAFLSARSARDIFLSIADRLSPVLAGISDPAKCHGLLYDELRRGCEEMAGDPLGKRRKRR